MSNFQEIVSLITNITDRQLRNEYQQADYRKVILPLTVLRRLDSVLEGTKDATLNLYKTMKEPLTEYQISFLCTTAGQEFYNVSNYTFKKLLDDAPNIASNLRKYIDGFSPNAREIIEYFNFDVQITKLDKADLLYEIIKQFTEVDLHPNSISNMEMGYVFEALIRKFSENVEAGQHYTPREVIKLMVNLLFIEDLHVLNKKGIIRKMYDPTCGTGGMLSEGMDYLRQLNPDAVLDVYGQEMNDETYAVCMADMLLKGLNPKNIRLGNTLINDGLPNEKFDYIIANPPYGDNWNKSKAVVEDEYKTLGFKGRFGAGLPRVNDGSFLFLQHMVSKMKPEGSRIAVVLSGSPLFTGSAGSGESEIRKWLIENDLVECIIGLPDQLFYNTGIHTYIWLLTNKKKEERKGKIQLIDASKLFEKMKKSLGQKRNVISDDQIEEITKIHQGFIQNGRSKVFSNEDFGYARITVERPLRLNYQFTEERIERVKNNNVFVNLTTSKKKNEQERKEEIEEGKALQLSILEILNELNGPIIYKNKKEFEKKLKEILNEYNLTLASALFNAIMISLSEKDETAEIVLNGKKQPEADTDLRDYENVPLRGKYTDEKELNGWIDDYVKTEVLQHVQDAWIDYNKTKIGYEIPFTKIFYKYEALRTSLEVDTDIQKINQEISSLMEGLLNE